MNKPEMEKQEYKYDAFISYRHAELDQFAAGKIQKQLEAFQLPKNLVSKMKDPSRTRIKRIFRDKEELPLTSNLEEPIMQALRESEFLIVICSPRLPQSLWCKKEVETFIEMHGREKVLAVLIEGEPEESFPEALLYREYREVMPDGTQVIRQEKTEPLAADMRGADKKEIQKKMKVEILRLLAAVFGCSFDDLRQRHREQKLKRLIAFSCAVSAVFFFFGAVSTALALQISQQKEEIIRQSELLQTQSDELNEQYQKVLITQSESMAEQALRQLEGGDRIQAVSTAWQALTGTELVDNMPYTPKAQYALTESLYAYANGGTLRPVYQIKTNAPIIYMAVSEDKQLILTVDNMKQIAVWRAENGEKIFEKRCQDISTYQCERKICFVGNECIAYLDIGSAILINLNTKEEIEFVNHEEGGEDSYVFDWFEMLSADSTGQYLSVSRTVENREVIEVFDIKQVLEQKDFQAGRIAEYTLEQGLGDYICMDETRVVFFSDVPEGIGKQLVIWDFSENRKTVLEWKEDISFSKIKMLGERLYFIGSSGFRQQSQDGEIESILCAVDLESGRRLWEYREKNKIFTDFCVNTECALLTASESYRLLDVDSGALLQEDLFSSSVIAMFALDRGGYFRVFTQDGRAYIVLADMMYTMLQDNMQITHTDTVWTLESVQGGYAVGSHMSSDITIYGMVNDRQVKGIAELENSAVILDFQASSSRVLYKTYAGDGNQLFLLDFPAAAVQEVPVRDGNLQTALFAGEKKEFLVLVYVDKMELFDAETMKLLKEESFQEKSIQAVQAGAGNVLLIQTNTELLRYDLNGFTQEEAVELPQEYAYGSMIKVCTSGELYAVADARQQKMDIRNVKGNTLKGQLDIPAALVTGMEFDDKGKYLFLSFLDEKYEVYDMETMEKCTQAKDLHGTLAEVVKLPENQGFIVRDSNGGSILNAQLETVGYIPDFRFLTNETCIIISNRKIFESPLYTLEMLLEEAESLLAVYNE